MMPVFQTIIFHSEDFWDQSSHKNVMNEIKINLVSYYKMHLILETRGLFNIKISSYRCRNFHQKDMMVSQNGDSTLHWRYNDHDGVSNHQPPGCLLNRLFRRRSKKTSKICVTGLCVGNSPGPVNSPHKGPVTRKMFPFDDVIMRMTVLTHWGQDKMDDIFQTTFSNAFSWMKIYKFR